MMKFTSIVLLLKLVASANAQDSTYFSGCNATTYYSSLALSGGSTTGVSQASVSSDKWTWDDLRSLVNNTHRNILPNIKSTSSEEDIFDALIDLWPGDEAGSTVHLIYRNISFPVQPRNTPETWTRGDFWPVDRGIPRDSPAFTDIHVKAPVDWSVNQLKDVLFFGVCGTVEAASSCAVPANGECPSDTAQDGKVFTPPTTVRGDIARALFYNALRYDLELGLKLRDCPPFADAEFGYMSELLKWHEADPVSSEEIARNDRACSRWQGNRNVFVDYPDLVQRFFGSPDVVSEGSRQYSKCSMPTSAPTAEPNACSAVPPGQISFFAFNSDQPDQVVFFPLDNIPSEVGSLYLTDNAWTGTDLLQDEGTVEYKIGPNGIKLGQVFAFGYKYKSDEGEFVTNSSSNFDLSSTFGDNLFLYCLNANGYPHFIAGLSFSGEWATAGLSTYLANQSALPDQLVEHGSVALPFFPNYVFNGTTSNAVPKVQLMAEFSNSSDYRGTTERIEFSAGWSARPTLLMSALVLIMVPLALV